MKNALASDFEGNNSQSYITSESRLVKYPVTVRALHWISALLILTLIPMGLYMASIDFTAADKFELYPWHRAFGVLVFILALLRLINPQKRQRESLPETLPVWQRRVAKLTHVTLYLCMLLIPVFGYLASSALPEFPGVPPLESIWFLFTDLPLFPVEKDYDLTKFAINVHTYLAYGLIALLVAHVGAAIKHKLSKKPEHDVLSRML